MCGIAGYVGSNAPSQRQCVESMMEALRHRGPDDAGIWEDTEALLGHRRLSIIDISETGRQPMISSCGRYVLTYNGEIYNFVELRRELIGKGAVFRGHSDSEVLLAAFVAWGDRCVERFNGMWAFAIWDRQTKRLFVSRDRFGEKPLYYRIDQGALWFASEIKALLGVGVASRSINSRAVADFAAERISDHTAETFFCDIQQLPAASSGWWEGGLVRVSRYWDFPPDIPAAGKNADLIEEIRALLEDAIKIRLRSDVTVGVLLSGGLDSSSVSCIAAHQVVGEIAAFSTIDREPVEEAAGIDAVLAASPNIRLYEDKPDDDCLESELTQCLWHQEQPFADGSMLAHFRLMRLARDSGVRVLLTGQAADEVFAGYPGYMMVHLGGLLRRVRLRKAVAFALGLLRTGQTLPLASIAGHALPPGMAAWLRRRRRNIEMEWLAPEYREPADSMTVACGSEECDPTNVALKAAITQRTLPGFLHYEDRNSMAFGVETRIPFLDHRLVEKVLPLASELKFSGARTKALLRDAVGYQVPHAIVSRLTKQGYPAPLGRWLRCLRQKERMRHLEIASSSPLLNFPVWKDSYVRFLSGEDRHLPTVWRGLVLALWHDRFIRQDF